jgi:predicted nucleic acid-binding protein
VRSVLVDTGPLVALCDEADALHARALEEVDRLQGPFVVCLPVLTEAHFLLPHGHLRRRLAGLLASEFCVGPPDGVDELLPRALAWLERYAEHDPDFTDAWLIACADRDSGAVVWTFDREFARIWRTLKRKKLRLS